MRAGRRWAAELQHVWFHRLRPGDWFAVDARVDEELRRRFGRELAMLSARPAREFLTDPQTALAAVLLFDQLPRTCFAARPRPSPPIRWHDPSPTVRWIAASTPR